MKTCLLLLGCVIAFSFAPRKQLQAKTYFYYGVSVPKEHTVGRQTILYTGIHQVKAEGLSFAKEKGRQWADFVAKGCAGKGGCTSDLNYYTSRETAKAAYAQILQSFSDTSKFVLKKVKFQ